ncbi:MAG: S8 family serine peptidase, partial [Elusimicrobia bacterium]|nr:S8 family serine peptidase [Elusimicrobiota bacterium]
MKVAVFRRWPLVFALAGLILSLRAQSAWSKAPPHRPGELIVKFRKLPSNLPGKFSPQSAGGLPSSLDRLLSAAGANDMTLLFPRSIASAWRAQSVSGGAPVSAGLDGIALVKFPESADIENLAALFAADPDVEYAEPNYLYHLSAAPNDTNFSLQWGLRNTGQSGNIVSGDPATGTAGADIKAAGAWDTTTGFAGVIVAVVDSGVDWDHLDLAANIWSNDDPVDGVDNDGNGKIDDVRGWDFGDKDNNPTDDSGLDSNGNPDESTAGHGTNAAGVIAAVGNNSLGVAGVMWKASIMPVKIADSTGNIYGAQFAQGIQYAAANGAKIINLSIGGSHTQSLADAIDYATGQGALIVAAAGNESTEDNSASYPAAYTSVVAVAATDRTDKKTSASNYGSWVDIAAPGLAVQTTDINNAYAWASGTSFASPMVAGIAGLIASYYTGISTAAIRSRLLSSADNIDALNPSFAGKLGSGRANAATALAPDVPAGISGSALGVSTITWSWGASSGALSYNVYSATSSTLLGNGVSTAAVVSALSTNTAYGIRVTGVNNSAESSLSQATTVYTLAAPPTSFALVEVHISSISVAWAANTNPAGTTTYRSEIWKAGGSTTTQTLSLTSATFTGLTPGTTYFLTVGALNGNGILTASNLEISTSTLGLVAPVSLSAAALGVSSITWSWPNVNNEEGFRVLTSTGGNLSGNLPPNTVSWTETGLSTNTATSRR